MIEIKNLNFYYEDQQVLHDIHLLLEKNTITGLIGPNGAGKSTLMRCIAGLEIPRDGDVYLDGQPILDNPQQSYQKIGYLPDIFGLSEKLTVIQSWTHAAASRGVQQTDLQDAVTQTATLLNLADKLYEPVGSLSRGQKQRVGIGQVIIHRPQLLILDEPASGLDPEARYELSQLFNLLKQQGMTLLVSSHILSELDEYCTHMLVIKEGRIQQYSKIISHDGTEHLTHRDALLPLMLRFTTPLLEAQQQSLLSLGYLSNVQFQGTSITVSISTDPNQRVQLIRDLVELKIPLIGVEPLKESLLQSYRNSLQQGA